nr:hypothetical protein [uncultured Lichenicoccus sp.]
MLKVEVLQDSEFALHDINATNLDLVAQIFRRDIEANHLQPASAPRPTAARRFPACAT